MHSICPLCRGSSSYEFFQDKTRVYQKCGICSLVFVPEAFHLSREQEKSEYDKHQNDLYDPGYRRFLTRIFEPLASKLPANARGLDFGCGPGPALAEMFKEQGFKLDVYDQFYAPNPAVLKKSFQFVCATEVLEHLRDPQGVLEQLWCLIEPGGFFAVMTKLLIDKERFASWHYKNDPTHIVFYSLDTLHYLAGAWGAELSVVANDAFIFQKAGSLG